MKWHASIYLYTLIVSLSANTVLTNQQRRVAVVGGGIGGSTASLFLREELGDDVEIVLFENDRIGGRLSTVQVGDRFYEAGGAVIHPTNHYMANLTENLGLRRCSNSGPYFTFGLYDGREIKFQTSHFPIFESTLNKLKLFYRYGYDLLRLDPWLDGVLKWYGNLYPAQEQKKTYASVYDLFHSASPLFDDLSSASIADYLKRLGFGATFIDELARIVMRTNYLQDVDIPAFVGAVSLAGSQPGLWAVEGGNYRVAEEALRASKATWKKSKVTRIADSYLSTGRLSHFHVSSIDSSGNSTTEDFDAVILAVPCTTVGCGGIIFDVEGIEEKLKKFPVSFHRTVANFVKGKVDTRQFGVMKRKDFPDCLYSISDEPLLFNSFCRQLPTDYGSKPSDPTEASLIDVWKIFTSTPLTEHHVKRLFVSHSDFVVADWMAYPNYDLVPSDVEASLPPFILDSDGAFVSVNAIEATASAMEQSVIGAKNAALLISNYLKKSR